MFVIRLGLTRRPILNGDSTVISLTVISNSDSRVDRASASGAVDSGSIPSLIKLKTRNLVFTA